MSLTNKQLNWNLFAILCANLLKSPLFKFVDVNSLKVNAKHVLREAPTSLLLYLFLPQRCFASMRPMRNVTQISLLLLRSSYNHLLFNPVNWSTFLASCLWSLACGVVFHPQVLKPDTKANGKKEIVKIIFAMTPKDLYFNEIVFQ